MFSPDRDGETILCPHCSAATVLGNERKESKCHHCNTVLRFDSARFGERLPCPRCGQSTILGVPPPPASAKRRVVNGETFFYDRFGVVVTNSRFIVRGQTYAMRNITSVRPQTIDASRALLVILLCGTFFILMPALAMIVSDPKKPVGYVFLLLAAGGAFLSREHERSLKPSFRILVTTSSGEQSVFHSADFERTYEILDALNESIVSRG